MKGLILSKNSGGGGGGVMCTHMHTDTHTDPPLCIKKTLSYIIPIMHTVVYIISAQCTQGNKLCKCDQIIFLITAQACEKATLSVETGYI